MEEITVYIIKSQVNGMLYVGMTENLDRRLAEYNAGKSKFTLSFIPWVIVYTENTFGRDAARIREKYLKSAAGKRFLKKQFKT